MQANQTAGPYTLLEYQSTEPRVFGIDVRPATGSGLRCLLAAMRWLGKSKAFTKELTFVVMTLPRCTDSHQISEIAECAEAEGLIGKLCLVIPSHAYRLPGTVRDVRRFGIKVLLGGVGKNSRFSDLIDHPIDGILIEPRLVANASGDPRDASVLDAIVALSANLGLRSFANDCVTQSEFDFATSAGISYVTCSESRSEVIGEFGSAARRVRARAQLTASR